jgi:hypothetical protein
MRKQHKEDRSEVQREWLAASSHQTVDVFIIVNVDHTSEGWGRRNKEIVSHT